MNARAVGAVGVVAAAAFAGGYALAGADKSEPAPAAVPKALELSSAAVSVPPASSAGALPKPIAPPAARRSPRGPARTQPPAAQPPASQPPAAPGSGIIEG